MCDLLLTLFERSCLINIASGSDTNDRTSPLLASINNPAAPGDLNVSIDFSSSDLTINCRLVSKLRARGDLIFLSLKSLSKNCSTPETPKLSSSI